MGVFLVMLSNLHIGDPRGVRQYDHIIDKENDCYYYEIYIYCS